MAAARWQAENIWPLSRGVHMCVSQVVSQEFWRGLIQT
jgi:hypothetical protein